MCLQVLLYLFPILIFKLAKGFVIGPHNSHLLLLYTPHLSAEVDRSGFSAPICQYKILLCNIRSPFRSDIRRKKKHGKTTTVYAPSSLESTQDTSFWLRISDRKGESDHPFDQIFEAKKMCLVCFLEKTVHIRWSFFRVTYPLPVVKVKKRCVRCRPHKIGHYYYLINPYSEKHQITLSIRYSKPKRCVLCAF
jgi:hypothetical protein